ncbi:CLAVATA3/ESR (CLE)-related protein 46-like isoform X2 [Gossypium arboreum]|uniref:CLAVATA3/ESR (CLE)-related protein 46-like isoform X2 n=1 Tax=Gossypium arboreum TaxID=29729 RepID=UPI0022F178F5|nr:CLAVATA3/ESR (CLE)-related protein 46-like isoform X2 [Gossypium arboreum]
MQHMSLTIHKMRDHVLIYLLLAWLLLIHYQLQGSDISVQAIDSVPTVHFKFSTRRSLMPRSRVRNALPTWVEMKKIHKSPSSPNPVKNLRSPSKH